MKTALAFAMLLFVLVASSCQATPPASLTGKVNQYDEYSRSYQKEESLRELLQNEDHISSVITGDTSKSVVLDAAIKLPEIDALPVGEGQVASFDHDMVQPVCDVFFGTDATYYTVVGADRDYYLQQIEILENELILAQQALYEFDDSTTITSVDAQTGEESTFEVTKEVLEKDIQTIEADIRTAQGKAEAAETAKQDEVELEIGCSPDVDYGEPCIAAQTSLRGEEYLILTTNENHALHIGPMDFGSYEQMYPIEYQLVDVENPGELFQAVDARTGEVTEYSFDPGTTREEAVARAQEFVKGFSSDFEPCGVFAAVATSETVDCGFKCFFTRVIDGVPIGFEDHAIDTTKAESVPVPYEEMSVVVNSDGIVGFDWISPVSELTVINENADPLAMKEVLDVAEGFLKGYLEESVEEEGALTIENITLSMMRTRKADAPDDYLFIPVWDFYGAQYDDGASQSFYPENYSYVTVDAITGAIIDRSLGY